MSSRPRPVANADILDSPRIARDNRTPQLVRVQSFIFFICRLLKWTRSLSRRSGTADGVFGSVTVMTLQLYVLDSCVLVLISNNHIAATLVFNALCPLLPGNLQTRARAFFNYLFSRLSSPRLFVRASSLIWESRKDVGYRTQF
jgi:hypothetical protein